MKELATSPIQPRTRRHLLSPTMLTQMAETKCDVDLTRGHGQGNGLRVHGIYFAAISLAVLVAFIVAIAVASATM